jgi:hypothetical protein
LRIHLTGINHTHSHDDWIAARQATTEGASLKDFAAPTRSGAVTAAIRTVEATGGIAEGVPAPSIRPACDGFRFVVDGAGGNEDSTCSDGY